MSTIDNKEIVQRCILNGGTWNKHPNKNYPQDGRPPYSIWQYTSSWGGVAWKFIMRRDQMFEFLSSPAVLEPVQIWTEADGLLDAGRAYGFSTDEPE